MNKRRIKWEKLVNPLISVNEDGETNDDDKMLIKAGPFGISGYKSNPDFPSEKAFVGHTNFDITEEVMHIIEDTEGVEVLNLVSPYRFRLICGKAFNSKKVRRNITTKLCASNNNVYSDIDNETEIYKETLRLRGQELPWGMYILPNGQFESVLCKDENQLEEKLHQYSKVRDSIGGIIISE